MKSIIIFLLTAIVGFAGDMISDANVDFKRPDLEALNSLNEARAIFDPTKDRDREFLERRERDVYSDAMMEVSSPFFRDTALKKGDDWRMLWTARQKAALEEVAGDKAQQGSLRKAFAGLGEFTGTGNTLVLERVVRARFGGEPAWILLVHWEKEDNVREALDAGKEAKRWHILIVAMRVSNQHVISVAACG